MYHINPEFTRSKDNYDEMAKILQANINDLKVSYNSQFKKLELITDKTEKQILLNKMDKLNNLIQVIKDFKICSNNLIEQYFGLYANEKSSYKQMQNKYQKLKKFASDKGIDVTYIDYI
jgi:hypothetical protein